jgi:hypothetical protein
VLANGRGYNVNELDVGVLLWNARNARAKIPLSATCETAGCVYGVRRSWIICDEEGSMHSDSASSLVRTDLGEGGEMTTTGGVVGGG